MVAAVLFIVTSGGSFCFGQLQKKNDKKYVGIKPKKNPNIVFIMVDDMGWKDLGTYGSNFYETPNIDKLASQGMKFMDAYASSTVCSPSRSSIMTGQYPVHTGIIDWIVGMQNTQGPEPTQKLLAPEFTFNLPKSEITIAQALKNHGYVTCYAGKWHLGLKPSSWPKAEGFDCNYGGWAAGNPTAYGMGGYFSPWNNPKLKNGPKGAFLTDRLTMKAIGFIKKATLGTAGLALGFSAKSYSKIIGANKRVNMAVVGLHGRGKAHIRGFSDIPDVEIVHICDVDDDILANGMKVAMKNKQDPKATHDFRTILDSKNLDVISIATPDHWHATATILGCTAGKHVYVEKPCGHNPEEGIMMIEAAAKHNRLVQMGSQRRSWPNMIEAVKEIHKGVIGEVHYASGWYANERKSIGHGKKVRIPSSVMSHIDLRV